MVGDEHVASLLPELGENQLAKLRQTHALTVEVIRGRRTPGYGGSMNTSELPGVSGPVWTIVVLAMLLAALAALVYRLYTNRKR
jgi:hypothetical protein